MNPQYTISTNKCWQIDNQ